MRYVKPFVLGILSFALGAAVTRYYDTHRLAAPQAVQNATLATENGTRSAGDNGEADVSKIDFDNQPLWAYGFDKPPMPGEKARPQNPPNRNLRPEEDPGEQTKSRRLDGSDATYSLVDIRDGQNVIDWF